MFPLPISGGTQHTHGALPWYLSRARDQPPISMVRTSALFIPDQKLKRLRKNFLFLGSMKWRWAPCSFKSKFKAKCAMDLHLEIGSNSRYSSVLVKPNRAKTCLRYGASSGALEGRLRRGSPSRGGEWGEGGRTHSLHCLRRATDHASLSRGSGGGGTFWRAAPPPDD